MTNRLLSLLLVVTTIAINCKKHTSPDCVKAKIIRVTCASTVMQALNDNSIGEDKWTNIYDSTKYDNVFNVSNSCKIASEHKTGDVVYITVGKPVDIDCIRCAIYDAAPNARYDVTSIGNLPCDELTK